MTTKRKVQVLTLRLNGRILLQQQILRDANLQLKMPMPYTFDSLELITVEVSDENMASA